MKNINEAFEDCDYKALKKAKGKMTWRKFILTLVKETNTEGKNG